jgi:hypothetical protein
VQGLLYQWGVQRWFAAAFPLLMGLLLVEVPGYCADTLHPSHRPLRETYWTLLPFTAVIQDQGRSSRFDGRFSTVIVTPGYGFETCAYVRQRRMEMCESLDYHGLRRELRAEAGWWPLLAARGATMFYADETVTGDPEIRRSLLDAEAAGWEVLMRQRTERGERMLLRRRL